MSNQYYSIFNFGIGPESDLSSIPELDSDSSFEELPVNYPTQLVYSPIIRPIKTRLIDKNKIIKFLYKDIGKKIKRLII